jgi:enhancing lycopene biosynthesis protein 2
MKQLGGHAMPRVAVILSGCGVQDGSEIQEAVTALIALDEAGASVACLAPDKAQRQTTNHRTGKPAGETRNVLVESARIARGRIQDLSEAKADDFDAVLMPGGFGAALNLCDFAVSGSDCKVDPSVERFLLAMHDAKKPIAAICIAPVIVAKLFGKEGVKVTIGDDADTAAAIERMGAKHVKCSVSDAVVDETHRVVTTPAYMLAKSPKDLRQGIEKCVKETLRLV